MSPYYDKLVGNATKNFVNLVISREMIEMAIKVSKIMTRESSTRKEPGIGKKKEETSSVNYASQPYRQGPYPYYQNQRQQTQNSYSLNIPRVSLSTSP